MRLLKKGTLVKSTIVSLIPLFAGSILSMLLFFTCRGEALREWGMVWNRLVPLSDAYEYPHMILLNALVQSLLLITISSLFYRKEIRRTFFLFPLILIGLTYYSDKTVNYFWCLSYEEYQNMPFPYASLDKLFFPEFYPTNEQRVPNRNTSIEIILEPDGIWHKYSSYGFLEKEYFTEKRDQEVILDEFCKKWEFFSDSMAPKMRSYRHNSWDLTSFLVETVPPLDTVAISKLHTLAKYIGLTTLYVKIDDSMYLCQTTEKSRDSLYTILINDF